MKDALAEESEECQKFLDVRPIPGQILFIKLAGSRSHNTNHANSDRDYTGVFLRPTGEVLQLNPPTDTISHDSSGEVVEKQFPDHAFYEVHKLCKLIVKGNPAIVEMLFTEHYANWTDQWDELREHRMEFLTKNTVKQYLGYVNGQLSRLKKRQLGFDICTSKRTYEEKWAYHIIRLCYDAARIASGTEPLVWKEGKERETLMKIRNCEYSWGEIEKMMEKEISIVENMKPWNLPDEADEEVLNDWLIRLRKSNW